MSGMAQEIYCDYCRGFKPLGTDSFSLLCGNCGSIVGRLNSKGQFHCEDCSAYQEPAFEEFHKPLPEDTDNQGWLVADVCCARCRSILLVIREPESVAAH